MRLTGRVSPRYKEDLSRQRKRLSGSFWPKRLPNSKNAPGSNSSLTGRYCCGKIEVMKIKVKLIGPFIYQAGFSEKELDLEKPTTAGQLLSLVNLQEGRPKIMTRNGKAISPQEELEDGDRIAICPIYSGG